MFVQLNRGLMLSAGCLVPWGIKTEDAAVLYDGECDYWQNWIVSWSNQEINGIPSRIVATSEKTHAISAFSIQPSHQEKEAESLFFRLREWLQREFGPSVNSFDDEYGQHQCMWKSSIIEIKLNCKNIKNVLCCWLDITNQEEEEQNEWRPRIFNRAKCRFFPERLEPYLGRKAFFEMQTDSGIHIRSEFQLITTDVELKAEPYWGEKSDGVQLTLVMCEKHERYHWELPKGLLSIQFYPYLATGFNPAICKLIEAFGQKYIFATRFRFEKVSEV
jgi:hypothetical protein